MGGRRRCNLMNGVGRMRPPPVLKTLTSRARLTDEIEGVINALSASGPRLRTDVLRGEALAVKGRLSQTGRLGRVTGASPCGVWGGAPAGRPER